MSLIYVLPASGGEPRLVTPLGPSYWHGWSPDGKTLAYCAARDDEYDVYTIPVAGGEETRLTTAQGLDDGPDYSPDGRHIYFNSNRTGTMQVWRMNADGSDQLQITFDEHNDWFPHPSPDGKWIVFLSYEKGVEGHPPNKDVMLRMMPIEGGDVDVLARLFGGQGTINVPSWSPDSTQIAFVSYRLTRPPHPDEGLETRERAVTLLLNRVSDPDKLRHVFAVEATMRELARETGGDPTQWGLAGLLHDIDLAETASAGKPSEHGIVGARLLAEQGYREAVVHAVEAHDDAAGVERTRPIDHALYCADRAYWAIHSSGLRFPSPEAATATPALVVEALERRGITDRIDEALRRECGRLGLTLDDVLRLSLDALRAMPEPEAETPASATRRD